MAFPPTAVMAENHASPLYSDIIVRQIVLMFCGIAVTLTGYGPRFILEDIFHLSRILSDTSG